MQFSDSFLKQIHTINKHHEEIARLTGENFNIFKILGLSSDELSHTSLIASLLSPKGSHGQGEKFLILFLEEVNIQSFNASNAKVEKEKYINPIDKESKNGGIIDILISDYLNKKIIIENKIYAEDQKNQLLRYSNYDKNAKLFYLTLNGADASQYSLGGLDPESYTRISYRETILNWLKKCKNESANFPLLRETISQYILLIKKLTGQARSQEMENEIIEVIMSDTRNIESAFSIAKNIDELKKRIVITKLLPSLVRIAEENGLEKPVIKGSYLKAHWGFDFAKNEWNNYKLRFKFLAADFKNFIYGFYSENDVENIHEALKSISSTEWKTGQKTRAYKSMENYKDWHHKVFINLCSEQTEKENELLALIDIKTKELLSLGKELQSKGFTL